MIKIYDSSLEKYVAVASNRGDKLYTKDINFTAPELPNYDDDSSIITIDEALTSISNEIKSVKEGVAWVYKNGTIGGGGGTGVGSPKFKVSTNDGVITNDSIIVNNNQTLNLSFSISGVATGRKMNITIKDNKGNYYGYNNSTFITSSKNTIIQIPNIKEDIIIDFSGYDQETLSIIESYSLSIKVSTLKIEGPESVEISKSEIEYNITYNVSTTYGQVTYIVLSTIINGNSYEYVSDTFIDSRQISFNIFDIFNGLNLEELLKSETSISNMELKAKVIAGDYSDEIITSIVFTSENKISIDIIPISSIISTKPSYEYVENDNISFNIKLYFSTNEFYLYYKLYQVIEEKEQIVYERGDYSTPTSDRNKISNTQFYSKNNPITISYPTSINSNYPVYVYVKAWDRNNQEFNGEITKWFGIKSDENWQQYNLSLSGLDKDIDGGLNYLYYEYDSNKFGDIEISNKVISSRNYKGNSINESNIKGYIEYYNANNITNGVLLRGKSNENVNTLRMSSKSYGILYDDKGIPFKPFTNNKNNWMLNPEGWTISLTIKSDIQSDKDNVVFSCASFDNLGNFSEGIYITTTDVNVKFTNSTKQVNKWNLSTKLSQNTINQVDIVYKPLTASNKNIGEIRIYVNSVLAKGGIETDINFEEVGYYPTITSNMIIGATNNGKEYVKFADSNIYRMLFYKRALTPYHITKNFIKGEAEYKLLEDGNIDRIKNNELRNKNFFTNDGKCSIIDNETYTTTCSYIKNLYTHLSNSSDNPLPIVLVKVDSNFRSVVDGRYTEDQVAEDKGSTNPTITKEYNAVITIIKEKSNKPFIMGSNGGELAIGDNSGEDCTVKLQGTSTLGNKSKNFEISFGAGKTEDNINKENLVQVFEDMLPENSYILKADVMDSGHANNAAIGGFVNDFLSTYKTTANQMSNNMYAQEIKATTKGYPVLMFMQFGDNASQEFLGIYSFNLGRTSYYNLGYQIFDGYYKVISSKNDIEKTVIYNNHKIEDTTIEFPALVSSYETIPVPYNSNLSGVDSNATTAVCYECNGNNNIVGTFQQSDNNVINEFYDRVYPNIDNANSAEAFKRFRKIFVATSNLYECDPEYLCKMEEGDEYLKTRSLLERNSKGEFYNNNTSKYEVFNKNNVNNYRKQESWLPTDSFLSLTSSQTNENENNVGLNWEFASAYFTLAMLFGLTDSLGKNLNIRSFNLEDWYIEFYDMDTGLALTNAGYETVKNDVYLDKFSLNSNKQEIDVKINGYKEGGYDTINSRLFNIIRFFTNKNYTNTGTKPLTNYRKIWEDIRKTILRNPNDFIDNYYIKQNENVGEIIFNYDYDIKYINDEIDMITNPNSNIKSGSINFLHGNRVNYVRDWFTTHVFFLDGVFDIKCKAPLTNETQELYGNAAGTQYYGTGGGSYIESDQSFNESLSGVVCPYITFSNQNDRVNPSFDGYKDFKIKSNVPMFFIYNNGTLNQRLYIDENKQMDIKLYFKSGNEQTMTFNYAPYLTVFDKFGTLSYVNMTKPNLDSLTELDLSNTKTLSGASFDISPLVELRKLNMNNTQTTSNTPLIVNLQNAKKISYIDLRNANVNSLTLPGYGNTPGGSLEEIYIDKTTISDVDLSGHAMLKKFSALDCKNLSSLIFRNNILLTDIGNIPTSLTTLVFDNCDSLETLNLSNMEKLQDEGFVLGKMKNLKNFTYSHKTSKEYPSGITKLNFTSCPNIETINLSGFAGDYIILNIKSQNTLKNINISNSNINHIIWYDEDEGQNFYSSINNSIENIIDLFNCINIENINISGQKNIKYLLLPENKVIENDKLNITYCESLERIIGDITVNVNKFTNLSKFRFNEVCKYDMEDNTSNIILLENGDVSLYNNYEISGNDNENGDFIINYDLNNLLTHYEFIEDGASLNNSFSGTGINVSDLYAILIKLRNWKNSNLISEENPYGYIEELNKTFANCNNIKTKVNTSKYLIEQNDIKLNLFEGFDNLKEIISTFSNCSNINGAITQIEEKVSEKNSIFSYLPQLTKIENVFNGCGDMRINSYVFNNNKNLESIISPFSEKTRHILVDSNISNGKIRLDYVFVNLENLKEIINVFYNTNVNIDYDNTNISNIFINNPNLKTINRLFANYSDEYTIYNTREIDISDIFGGLSKYNGKDLSNAKYPVKLENLNYAFALDNNIDLGNMPTLKWDNLDYLFYNQEPILNDNIYSISLKSCDYMFNYLAAVRNFDDDGYYNYTIDGNGTIAKFPIQMFNFEEHKLQDENGKEIDVYFSNLKSCEGLFMRSAFKDELCFPGDIFKYCTAENLNLSHLLEDTIMTPIKLVNEDDGYACFTNCKLGDISSMFKNCFKGINKKDFIEKDYEKDGLYKLDKGGLHGTIPYKFFKNKGKISNMESVFEGCCHLGVKYDVSGNFTQRDETCFYNIKKPDLQTVIDVSNKIKDVSALLDLVEFDNGIWKWNAWSYDGTTFDSSYLEALNNIVLNGETYIEAKHNNIPNYIDLEWKLKDASSNIIPPKENNIMDNLSEDTCGIKENSNLYNSLKVSAYDSSYIGIVNVNEIPTPIYRIYYDADYDIKNVNFDTSLLEEGKSQLWNCDSYTYLELSGNKEPYNYRHELSNVPIKFITNYMCPMDLFRYCSNNCNINNIFKNLSRFNNEDKREKYCDYVYGLIGRIPPKLFYPLNIITQIKNVFENCKGIIPYAQSLDGMIYNFCFTNNTKLEELEGVFKGCMILGQLSNKLFDNNKSLLSLSEMFKNAYMPYHYANNNEDYIDYNNFVPLLLFSNTKALTNLSFMFGKDNNQNDYNVSNSYLYFDIENDLLNIKNHPFLNNVNYMFAYQTNIQRDNSKKDTFINFTEWYNIKDTTQNSYIGANFNMEIIPKSLGGNKEKE